LGGLPLGSATMNEMRDRVDVRVASPRARPRSEGGSRVAALAVAIALGGLCSAPEAHASFHLAEIDEVLVGFAGDSNAQFVEIEMLASGQHLVAGSKLAAFDANGAFTAVLLTVGSNVASGNGRRWIMATNALVTASGVAADFVFAGGLPADGMVCWGKPTNEQTPSTYVDCVSYGAYIGPANVHTAAPHPRSPSGASLQRTGHSNDSSADFACSDVAQPENNAGESAPLAATTPCEGVTTTTTIQSTTTTLSGGGVCGDGTGDGNITASDALLALAASVGTSACDLCLCDVDQSGAVAASDALRILNAAVGAPVALDCIAC
jgi:hypothetical protein